MERRAFYLRTGKRLARPTTEVASDSEGAAHGFQGENVESNSLVLNIQPDEVFRFRSEQRRRVGMQIRPSEMDFGISRRLEAVRAMLMQL
jgi:glucose-6-phosphate 1-dehydrogenase